MKKLFTHPIFLFGLVIRLLLIVFMVPYAIKDWYAPFLDVSTNVITIDPWLIWINSGGNPSAFPYGFGMWLIFVPLSIIAKFTGLPISYSYKLTLLVADFCLLITLNRLVPDRQRLHLLAYWLSPVIIIASYGLGLNDLIPALLLFLSILFVKNIKLNWAGGFIAAAISAKLSMIVALPFFAIYFFHNRALRVHLPKFLVGFSLIFFVFSVPFVFSKTGIQMLLSNPEMSKIYQISIALAGNVSIYIVPLIYFIVLYFTWRVRRLNFELFQSTTGMAFLLIVLLTPASPGWFVWCVPFFVLYQAISGRIAILMVGMFSGAYLLSTLLLTPFHLLNGSESISIAGVNVLGRFGSFEVASFLHTAMVAVGIFLAIRIWREAISRNDFFRLSRKPFVIGIAGDSGAGKDTFADAVTELFGVHSVAKLSGDDYHLWDRQKPMWQVMTHLNPMANDLEGFSNDLVSLTDGKSVLSKHYDHKTGKMSKPFRLNSNDFIIVSGLHALYLPILRECYDLKIYLNIDEGLRRYFKLKRDVYQRGHPLERVLSSFQRREPDAERFIRPQYKYADLIFSLQPIHPMIFDSEDGAYVRLKLVVITKNGVNELSVHRVLVGVCGLHVDIMVSDDGAEVHMTIEGETTAADIEMAAQILCPRVLEFLDTSPKWQDGLLGLMQLITLYYINQALIRRFI